MSHTIIAVDAGGTKIRAGLITPKGKILKSIKIPTETSRGKDAVFANIVKSIETVWSKDAKAIGIGMAGVIDWKKGIYHHGPNFPKTFKNVPIATLLQKHFKIPVKVDNDVHCFTLAESKFGVAKRFSTVVGLTLGTGIGGGIVIDGKLLRGRDNIAGEIGHISLDFKDGPICSCGKKGHFEAFSSGSAMRNLYKMYTGKTLEPLEIEQLAKKGDSQAKMVVNEMVDGLVEGLSNVLYFINPDIIVVGGGLAHVDIIWKPTMLRLKSHIAIPELRNTPVVRSQLGGDANLLGAALITA